MSAAVEVPGQDMPGSRESFARPLELTVSDFGPIAEASIDLRPMSVFVGPSNTGKSCMAALIYSLHRFFNGYSRNASYNRAQGARSLAEEFDLNRMQEMLLPLETAPSLELQEPVAALVRQSLDDVAHLGEVLGSEIARCLGTGRARNLIRYSGGTRAEVSLHVDPFKYDVAVKQETQLTASIPDTMPVRIESKSLSSPEGLTKSTTEDPTEAAMSGFLKSFASACIPGIVGPLARPAHYLPGDRAGIMHAHQVAVRGLIAGASSAALRRESPMPVLSGILGDFLEQLVALADSSRAAQDVDYDRLAQNLEQTLLRGAVRIEPSPINYPSFVFRPSGGSGICP